MREAVEQLYRREQHRITVDRQREDGINPALGILQAGTGGAWGSFSRHIFWRK